MKSIKTTFITIGALLSSMPAYAHHFMGNDVPSTFIQGMLSGLAHPIIGVDHFAFVLMIGLLAAALSGTSRYLVPAAFVVATVAGTGIHMASANLPVLELVIAFSIIASGVLVLLKKQLPALMLGIALAGFGIFHGYAYGEAIVGAESTPLMAYLIGFSIIQYFVVVGIVVGMSKLASRSQKVQLWLSKGAATFATITGVTFFAMNLA
jgi:urease accessory protein